MHFTYAFSLCVLGSLVPFETSAFVMTGAHTSKLRKSFTIPSAVKGSSSLRHQSTRERPLLAHKIYDSPEIYDMNFIIRDFEEEALFLTEIYGDYAQNQSDEMKVSLGAHF